MSIDLYFIGKCKDFVSTFNAKEVSYGWGINSRGDLRRPEQWIRNVPIVIDDSIVSRMTESFMQALLPYCEQGCILDFEKKPSQFHLTILNFFDRKKVSPLWIPANYFKYAPNAIAIAISDLPHNSWRSFCAAQYNLYADRWILEYHPLNKRHESATNNITQKPLYLENAICMAHGNENYLHYYDTIYTIATKIKIAKEYGCQGVLAIASEWKTIK